MTNANVWQHNSNDLSSSALYCERYVNTPLKSFKCQYHKKGLMFTACGINSSLKCVVRDTLSRSLKLKLWRSLQFGSSVPLFRTKILLLLAGTSTNFSSFLSDPYFHPTRHAAFKRNLDATNNVVSYSTIVLRHSFNILCGELTFNFLSTKPSSHKL
jgi:hypothetical protein